MSFVFSTSVPFRVPVVEGGNTTLIVQLPPPSTPPTQLSVSEKSPLTTMLPPKVNVDALLLVSVTGSGGLDVPTACEPKVRLLGFSKIPVAVADKRTVCGLAGSLSDTTKLP